MSISILDALKQKPKHEFLHGVVLDTNPSDRRVQIRLSNGTKLWLRHNASMSTPEIGDKLSVGGDKTRFIIDPVDKSIPKNTTILLV